MAKKKKRAARIQLVLISIRMINSNSSSKADFRTSQMRKNLNLRILKIPPLTKTPTWKMTTMKRMAQKLQPQLHQQLKKSRAQMSSSLIRTWKGMSLTRVGMGRMTPWRGLWGAMRLMKQKSRSSSLRQDLKVLQHQLLPQLQLR